MPLLSSWMPPLALRHGLGGVPQRRIERERGLQAAQRTIGVIDQLPVAIAGVDRHTVLLAAHFKARYLLSYADAFSVALAQIKGGELLTGDPEFKSVESEVPIHWLPR